MILLSKIAIINVGCNASHIPLQSPIFEDGRFEFLPIPEETKGISRYPTCPKLPRYLELRSFYDRTTRLTHYIPKSRLSVRAHNDPEFETFTYADYPTKSPRSANLKKLGVGDHLFFLARLVLWKNDGFTKNAGFYFVGYFEIEEILRNVIRPVKLDNFSNNVHVRRALVKPEFWDGFWVFRGSMNSRRFLRAIPFTRRVAEKTMVDRENKPWYWDPRRSELQVIGSYTRSCRIIEDKERISSFWDIIVRDKVSQRCDSRV